MGFIDRHSRKNILEDAATLATLAESEFVQHYYGPIIFDERNDRLSSGFYHTPTIGQFYHKEFPLILSKIDIAIKYGIIPRELKDFLRLKTTYFQDEAPKYKDIFADESEQFLKQYPNSNFEIFVRGWRGDIYSLEKNSEQESKIKTEDCNTALSEYKHGLVARFKGNETYKNFLIDTALTYWKCGNQEKAVLYLNAYSEYDDRLKSNYFKLPIVGVNDFLEKNGEVLPK